MSETRQELNRCYVCGKKVYPRLSMRRSGDYYKVMFEIGCDCGLSFEWDGFAQTYAIDSYARITQGFVFEEVMSDYESFVKAWNGKGDEQD